MKSDFVFNVAVTLSPILSTYTGVAQWLMKATRYAKEWSSKVNYRCEHCANVKVKEGGEERSGESSMHLEESQKDSAASNEGSTSNLQGGQGSKDKDKGKKKQFENKFNFNGLRSHLSSK